MNLFLKTNFPLGESDTCRAINFFCSEIMRLLIHSFATYIFYIHVSCINILSFYFLFFYIVLFFATRVSKEHFWHWQLP